jgi:hypothetical protein
VHCCSFQAVLKIKAAGSSFTTPWGCLQRSFCSLRRCAAGRVSFCAGGRRAGASQPAQWDHLLLQHAMQLSLCWLHAVLQSLGG